MMIEQLDVTNDTLARALFRVQKASYQIEADLIGFSEIPPLQESLADLQQSQERFYGCWLGECLAGAISYEVLNNTLDICRMMVHPDFFRKGVAAALLNYVDHIASVHEPNIAKITVSTGADNLPAIRLYEKYGFRAVLHHEVVPGLWIRTFRKEFVAVPEAAEIDG
jgi:ribosomal protein S18 acetylase RimI-like enzyme